MKLESYILNDFFEILNKINANYCVMNNYKNMPEVIPSDVDFAVDIQTFNKLDSLIIKLAKKHDISVTQKIWHGYNKCAYILSPLELDDYFWLQLDFFVDFSARGFPNLMPNKMMLDRKIKYKNFYIPRSEIEVPFILQRRIFKGDIEEKHLKTILFLYNKNTETVQKGIIDIFGKEEGKSLINFIESKKIEKFQQNFSTYRKKLKKISLDNTNLIYRLKYLIWQVIRAFYRFYYPTGLSIAFVGENTNLKKEFIEKFNNKISGSFHGSSYFFPKNIIEYLQNILFKDYWSRVTKRKTLWNLDTSKSNWKRLFNLRFIPKTDIIVYMNDDISEKSENNIELISFVLTKDKKQNEILMKKCIYIILKKQSIRTQRHLMSKVSPTAKERIIDV